MSDRAVSQLLESRERLLAETKSVLKVFPDAMHRVTDGRYVSPAVLNHPEARPEFCYDQSSRTYAVRMRVYVRPRKADPIPVYSVATFPITSSEVLKMLNNQKLGTGMPEFLSARVKAA